MAVLIVLTGVGIAAGFGVAQRDRWWLVALLAFAAVVCVALGVVIWLGAGANADATKQLQSTGTRMSLPVVAGTETTEDSIRYLLELQITPPGQQTVLVEHACGHGTCVAAARTAPDSQVPAIVDVQGRAWGVVHD
ncbi:MAG: hypothetical protein HOV77_05755 [Hamadaea sp.]|uniref:hypothetical protein n=1 Tax=Hamadaea sp. TaxID=2024425 RepID=UPI0017954E9E|nr:hypothetical protein [Hamadaea sp.]NUT18669.1 hypothetical protein [Hamadaea sp.]